MKRLNTVGLWLLTWVAALTGLAADSSGPAASAKAAAPASFQVSNKKFGDLLRPQDANSATGTRLVLYPAQPWKCMTWKFYPAGETAFYLQNHFTSKTFAAGTKADPAAPAVTQVPFAKAADERPVWQFTKLKDGSYKITEGKSGKALTAVKEGSDSTAKVVVQEWQDKEEQKWELHPIDPKLLTM